MADQEKFAKYIFVVHTVIFFWNIIAYSLLCMFETISPVITELFNYSGIYFDRATDVIGHFLFTMFIEMLQCTEYCFSSYNTTCTYFT